MALEDVSTASLPIPHFSYASKHVLTRATGIDYGGLVEGTTLGFAAIGTNNGHNGSSAAPMLNKPEVLADFSWRSIISSTDIGKQLTQFFYQTNTSRSYYSGCSCGGRQGFRAAQSMPDLFDGILAGSPVINANGLYPWFGYALETVLEQNRSPSSKLSAENWKLAHEEVMKQCDRLDGAMDGILEDVRKCQFDATQLQCWHKQRPGCLSVAQLGSLMALFIPFNVTKEPNGYEEIMAYAGHAHGDEVVFGNTLAGNWPKTRVLDWFRYVFYMQPDWTLDRYTPADSRASLKYDPGSLRAYDPDLTAFRDSGGKIIHYHGQSDQFVSVYNSDNYYDLVLNATAAGNVSALDTFYRYFRLSGSRHCGGGPGAWSIGGAGTHSYKDNVLLALVEWVEKGTAPEYLEGTKWKDDRSENGVEFKRKHCKHPMFNEYHGNRKDGKDEGGWRCVLPEKKIEPSTTVAMVGAVATGV